MNHWPKHPYYGDIEFRGSRAGRCRQGRQRRPWHPERGPRLGPAPRTAHSHLLIRCWVTSATAAGSGRCATWRSPSFGCKHGCGTAHAPSHGSGARPTRPTSSPSTWARPLSPSTCCHALPPRGGGAPCLGAPHGRRGRGLLGPGQPVHCECAAGWAGVSWRQPAPGRRPQVPNGMPGLRDRLRSMSW